VAFELEYVAPENLRKWWGTVREGLSECLVHETQDVFQEDVYWLLKTHQATLYIGLESGKYLGFVVLNQRNDPFSGRVSLNIWFLHSVRNGGNILAEGLAHIEQLADKINATTITFRSDQMCFERWAKPLGFRLHEIELIKEV